MEENPILTSKKLIENYFQNEISLKSFQFQIEILMGSFVSLSKEDMEEIKKINNQIEIIIYTIPIASQKNEIKKIAPKIIEYFNYKQDSPIS